MPTGQGYKAPAAGGARQVGKSAATCAAGALPGGQRHLLVPHCAAEQRWAWPLTLALAFTAGSSGRSTWHPAGRRASKRGSRRGTRTGAAAAARASSWLACASAVSSSARPCHASSRAAWRTAWQPTSWPSCSWVVLLMVRRSSRCGSQRRQPGVGDTGRTWRAARACPLRLLCVCFSLCIHLHRSVLKWQAHARPSQLSFFVRHHLRSQSPPSLSSWRWVSCLCPDPHKLLCSCSANPAAETQRVPLRASPV